MGIVIRQSVKSAVISYSGVAIGTFAYLWLYPKFLSPSQIGIIQFVQAIAITFASFFQFSAPSALIRYIPYFEKKDQSGFFNFILLCLLPIVVIGLTGLLLFQNSFINLYQDQSPEIIQYFYHIMILIFINVYLNILESYSKANQRIVVPNFLKDIFIRVFTIILITAYVLKIISFYQVITGILINYLLAFIFDFLYLVNLKVIKKKLVVPAKDFLKKVLTYAVYALIGSASGIVIARIDILMIGAMLGMDMVGVFTVTFFMGNVIEIPRRAVSQITSPFISSYWKNGNLAEINNIYKKASINLLLVGILLFLLIWSNVGFIFQVIPNAEIYEKGKFVILFISLAKLFDMSTGPNTEIIAYSDYYKFNLILSFLLSVLLFVSNLIFISIWGINGAAFATFLSMIIYNCLKYLFLKIKFNLEPFSKKYALVIVLGALTLFIAHLIHASDKWLQMILRSLAICSLFLGSAYFLKLSDDCNRIVNRFISKIV